MKYDTDSPIDQVLKSTLEAFRAGDFDRAETQAERGLALDFEHGGIQSGLKCAVFWKDRFARAAALPAPEPRGDFLIREWQGFVHRFRAHLDEPFEAGIEAIRGAVFERAAESYLEQMAFEEESRRPDLEIKAARAYKTLGSFDKALACLDRVLQARPDDASALAEMADCFEAVGNVPQSRLFFREAFYLNPQAVDVEGLRSEVMQGVVRAVAAEGLTGTEAREWIPVHAVIQGVFNVKRDLKPLELGQLKQNINALKSELRDGKDSRGSGLPKLLNRYFWLIDHYFSVKEDRSKIEDILLNIKLLDQRIYELYTH
jgi:tetratricopeptide (TPR) repeat protein